MSESGPDLIVAVRDDLVRAGFHLGDPEGGASVRAGLRVYAVDGGVGVRWRSSDYISAMPSCANGVDTAEQSTAHGCAAGLVGLLAQAGHTVAQDPASGDLIVTAPLR
ncbi:MULTISPECIES: hypothetical protein [unclassified Nonomuraea]|uniref:hypothetical protein n=1 Tax=unclassified Nonomuraea TaxID=2593643 RepID=UPI0033E3D5F1